MLREPSSTVIIKVSLSFPLESSFYGIWFNSKNWLHDDTLYARSPYCQKQEVIHSTPQSRRFDSSAVRAAWAQEKAQRTKPSSVLWARSSLWWWYPSVSGISQCVGVIPVCWKHPSVLGTSWYIRDICVAHKPGPHEASRPHETDEEDQSTLPHKVNRKAFIITIKLSSFPQYQ